MTNYTVQAGDTLTKIANEHCTTVKRLVELNGISDPNKIKAGQILIFEQPTPSQNKAVQNLEEPLPGMDSFQREEQSTVSPYTMFAAGAGSMVAGRLLYDGGKKAAPYVAKGATKVAKASANVAKQTGNSIVSTIKNISKTVAQSVKHATKSAATAKQHLINVAKATKTTLVNGAKVTGKFVKNGVVKAKNSAVKATKATGKFIENSVETAAQNSKRKVLNAIAKAGGKSMLKKIPLVGLAVGIGFAIGRLTKGDYAGAAAEAASGAAACVPGIGTVASCAIDAGLAVKDIYDENK